MKERPILFQSSMIRAILEGQKSQTRRIMLGSYKEIYTGVKSRPYGAPGDRLWVKETFRAIEERIAYCADVRDGIIPYHHCLPEKAWRPWKPSIFMPRWASRITLEITEIRVERLQDISHEDAKSEGTIDPIKTGTLTQGDWRGSYRILWNSINLKPRPNYAKGDDGKKRIVYYESYPWSLEDFDARYPGIRASGQYRGKYIVITPNPWVWVVTYKPI